MNAMGHKGGSAPIEKPKNMKGTLKRLLKYLMPYKFSLFAVVLFLILSTLFTALGPVILGEAINEIQRGFEADVLNVASIRNILLVLFGIYFLSALFSYWQQYLMTGVSQKTMYGLRKSVDYKINTLPLNYFDSNTFGDVLSRVTNDVDTVSNSLQQSITQVISSALTIVFILGVMLYTSPLLTLIGIITLPLSALATFLIAKNSQKFFKGQQKELGNMNGHVEEMYTGHNVIKAFNKEDDVIKTFDDINEKLYVCAWKSQFISSIIMPVLKTLGNIGYVLVCVVGGMAVISGALMVGNITTFIQCLRQFNMPLTQLASIANIMQSTSAAAERIFEFLDETEEVPESTSPITVKNVKGEVTFQDVKFGYSSDKTLIHKLNISIKSGDKVAIVGPTGAGKTTLVNLLLRFYDVNDGKIAIDGIDIRDMKRIELRELFGMVLQDAWLFKGTIMDNIRYGNLFATDDEVVNAAKAAYANGFIRTLPNGYQFVLNEDASNVSQGERQLITIARAILADNPIMILDEATSSVDTRTEMLIQKAMKKLMQNRTSFVIAHRLSTIVDADVILVLKDGDIIETGTHEELLEAKGFYADLYNSQFA